MPGRVRLTCLRCDWVDPLADDDVVAFELPVLCLTCQRAMLEDRRMMERRRLSRLGPWWVRGERRRGKDRRRE